MEKIEYLDLKNDEECLLEIRNVDEFLKRCEPYKFSYNIWSKIIDINNAVHQRSLKEPVFMIFDSVEDKEAFIKATS